METQESYIDTILHEDARVEIREIGHGLRTLKVSPFRGRTFIPFREWTTSYPHDLIRLALEIKGPAYLCDSIMRDEDPNYLTKMLGRDLFAYFTPEDFEGVRIMDFGCGAGASTTVLARLLPKSHITGIELEERHLVFARRRAEFLGISNIEFICSPSSTELPAEAGLFDFVIMSAVYEHLLPNERISLLPILWSHIRPGGFLFINQTPNRMFPIENHTTGIPLLNYMPSPLACEVAHRFSNRIPASSSWMDMLRLGIRGATEHEILKNLKDNHNPPLRMEPCQGQLRNSIDLWYSSLTQGAKWG